MPHSKPKPSDIAAEAKKFYIPYIDKFPDPNARAASVVHDDSLSILVSEDKRTSRWPRVTVVPGEAADVALSWHEANVAKGQNEQIAIVNMANEKRPGGDWESGLMAPEECLARRSNLVRGLTTPWQQGQATHYPIKPRGGIYTRSVCRLNPSDTMFSSQLSFLTTRAGIFRDGGDLYEVYSQFRFLPVISVAPVRRPKLDETGARYSFDQERELMKDKMRTILRIAAYWRHRNLCLGAFGVGPIFRNPVREVAVMWRQLLYEEREFFGAFDNIAFAIDTSQQPNNRSAVTDFEVFQHTFDASNVFATTYR